MLKSSPVFLMKLRLQNFQFLTLYLISTSIKSVILLQALRTNSTTKNKLKKSLKNITPRYILLKNQATSLITKCLINFLKLFKAISSLKLISPSPSPNELNSYTPLILYHRYLKCPECKFFHLKYLMFPRPGKMLITE